jgi:hypothetical protein
MRRSVVSWFYNFYIFSTTITNWQLTKADTDPLPGHGRIEISLEIFSEQEIAFLFLGIKWLW